MIEENKTLHSSDTVTDGDSPNSISKSIIHNRRQHQSISSTKPVPINITNIGESQATTSLTMLA